MIFFKKASSPQNFRVPLKKRHFPKTFFQKMKTYFPLQTLLVQKRYFLSKTDESSFYKTPFFQNKNFSKKCVLYKLFFKKLIGLTFFFFSKNFFLELGHALLTETFLRIAFLRICAYVSISLNP